MRVALIGCGLIGGKRLQAARALGHEVVAVADAVAGRAKPLAAEHGARVVRDAQELIADPAVEAVFVATSHDSISALSVAALSAGKHVLAEKPGGRNLAEVSAIAEAAKAAGRVAKVGYNHRFHPAVLRARSIVDAGELGPLMFIRGRYGHGGRPGYEREWRFDREKSGGGQLIDQGSHLVDLAHWFLGDIVEVRGTLRRFFWDSAVEDNVFLMLGAAGGEVAWLHATWTEWKNMFSFEIYGRDGKLSIEGLGGSYGVESLTHYRMLPGMGPPETTRWEWPFPDHSWRAEIAEFFDAIAEGRRPIGDAADAVEGMRIIERVYAEERMP
ncbi:MAG TPA: Gfo/Idh/MocA family oxidoreductase [Beijerinckiaceae bacterium]|jgi:predicted dehydrogenase